MEPYNMLKFSRGLYNKKLRQLETLTGQRVYSFSLPPGLTCPGAKICKCEIKRGKLKQTGPIRCYSAQLCLVYGNVYKGYLENLRILKKWIKDGVAIKNLVSAIPSDAEIVRWNCSGDFFSYEYFCVLMEVARKTPWLQHYCHTKSVNFVRRWLKSNKLPPNFSVSLSYGGIFDSLIPTLSRKYKLKSSRIVKDEEEGKSLKLKADRNDSRCCCGTSTSFYLPLHGIQSHDLNAQLKEKKCLSDIVQS